VIVVDDGSSDDTALLVSQEFPAATVVVQPPRGLPAARNRGASLATTRWVAFLDADDLWHPRHLELLIEHATANPGARVLSAAAVRFCTTALPNPPLAPPLPQPGPPRAASVMPVRVAAPAADTLCGGEPAVLAGWTGGWTLDHHDLLVGNPIMSSNALVDRQTFHDAGGFSVSLPAAEDYGFWLNVTRFEPILCTPEQTFFYRVTPTSMTFRKNLGLAQAAATLPFVAGVDLDEDPAALLAALQRTDAGRHALWMAYREALRRDRPLERRLALALAPALIPSWSRRARFAASAARARVTWGVGKTRQRRQPGVGAEGAPLRPPPP
jgi:hypothetical protein